MSAVCKNCGGKLSLFSRLGGRLLCSKCLREEQEEQRESERKEREEQRESAREARLKREVARAEYIALLDKLTTSPNEATALLPQLRAAAEAATLGAGEVNRLHSAAFRAVALKFLEDDILAKDEEDSFVDVAEMLGIDQQSFRTDYSDLFYRLIIARLNDGRLPEIAAPRVIAKRGEVVHAETEAALMKEVTAREFRAGHQGFSLRVAKGVRYYMGGTRGKSVVTGTTLLPDDTGFLSITSRRAVFAGLKRTLDLPYSKLVSLNVFTDGIQFHMENRTNAPLFRVENGEVIAATVNAAVQRLP